MPPRLALAGVGACMVTGRRSDIGGFGGGCPRAPKAVGHWAPSGPTSRPGRLEPPGAARRALRRHWSRARH
eukprot:scaffold98855_cov54-Phaeocystis_antarctica.AAC.3